MWVYGASILWLLLSRLGCVEGRLTLEPEVSVSYWVWSHTFLSPSADLSRREFVNYWRKSVHYHLGGLSLPRNSVVRLTDCPEMTTMCTVNIKKQHNTNNISVISGWWEGDTDRLCAMKSHLQLKDFCLSRN